MTSEQSPPRRDTAAGRSPARIVSADLAPSAILATTGIVADWQLRHPSPTLHTEPYGELAWTHGAFYIGVMALARATGSSHYRDAMIAMGEKHRWHLAPRPYHADDYVVAQTYLELYLTTRDPAMIGPTKERLYHILNHPATGDLHMGPPDAQDRWNWCDALFMGPPTWVRLYRATGDHRCLDFMDQEWRAASAFLYVPEERLYLRDSTFFDKREANGKGIFWSRGNGWVMAGLVRVLEMMPTDFPNRSFYERQFQEMAARIITLQQEDGLWRASLLAPEAYPLKEVSGSSFFAFAFAWGIRNGLLDRATYEPALRKAWAGLVQCVTPEGKLEHVQPIGADPRDFDPTHTDVFGTGAFLLAGSEMCQLFQNRFHRSS